MTPGVLREEQNLGCMAGFFQLFDRHQILAGKRIYSTRRLPSSLGASSPSPSERSDASPPSFSKELPPSPPPKQQQQQEEVVVEKRSPAEKSVAQSKTPLPLPVFEFKDGLKSSWKLREAPRLSLDSRLLDGKGKFFPREIRTTPVAASLQADGSEASDDQDRQRRSPSVVARLMGLDRLPESANGGAAPAPEPYKRAELRRSASESRASRDLLQQYPFLNQHLDSNARRSLERPREVDTKSKVPPKPPLSPAPAPPTTAFSTLQRKSFFDAQDFFPEPSKRINGGGGGGSFYGEIEKRLRMRGIDEPEKDLDTLKQILEALQLKGLLHRSHQHPDHRPTGCRNLVYEQQHQSPIVLMKPAPSPRRNDSPSPTRFGASSPRKNLVLDPRPRRDRTGIAERRGRNSPRTPSEPIDAKSPSSLARRRTNVDRRVSPVQSPRSGASPRRTGPDPVSRSPRTRKPPATVEISSQETRLSDESSTLSESSHSPTSQFDLERVKMEEYREGRSLLERCDKLLHSIAEITTTSSATTPYCCGGEDLSGGMAVDQQQQPSPVSVLDASASFYSDGGGASGASLSPSPALKRRIDFKDRAADREEETSALPVQPIRLLPVDEADAGDADFIYVAEMLGSFVPNRATELDVYLSMEKHHQKADPSKASRLHRRLVFDTVSEIAARKRQVSPWEAFSRSRSMACSELGGVVDTAAPAREIWVELKRIREPVPADDLCDYVCGVLRKDMIGCSGGAARGWGDGSVEMSDAVLDVERLIFKDLIAETIEDLAAALSSSRQKCRPVVAAAGAAASRRKLVF